MRMALRVVALLALLGTAAWAGPAPDTLLLTCQGCGAGAGDENLATIAVRTGALRPFPCLRERPRALPAGAVSLSGRRPSRRTAADLSLCAQRGSCPAARVQAASGSSDGTDAGCSVWPGAPTCISPAGGGTGGSPRSTRRVASSW